MPIIRLSFESSGLPTVALFVDNDLTTTITGLFRERFENIRYIDGLVQKRRNSIASALELHLSCTNPSVYSAILFTSPGWLLMRWSLFGTQVSAITMHACRPQMDPMLAPWTLLSGWWLFTLVWHENSSNSIAAVTPQWSKLGWW